MTMRLLFFWTTGDEWRSFPFTPDAGRGRDAPVGALLATLLMGILRFQGLVDFVAQTVEDFARGPGDLDFFEMTRAWKIYREFLLYSAGPESHQRNAVAEADCFAHVVGYEDHRASGF